jgi:hypothetical protein
MKPIQVEPGRSRRPDDECRRYRPVPTTFDYRANVINLTIEDNWTTEIQQQWRDMKDSATATLLTDLGVNESDRKVADYLALGPPPESFAFEHVPALKQVRSAFMHGDYYPALVGASTLGERIFNQLIRDLRDDFRDHAGTPRKIRNTDIHTDWRTAIQALHRWGVLSDQLAGTYESLRQLRNAVVHFNPGLDATAREPALEAVAAVQTIIAAVFAISGGAPRFIDGTSGGSFIARDAETHPVVRRVILPHCALVSPAHRLYPAEPDGRRFIVFDDADYDPTPLSDTEFAAALEAGVASMHPGWARPTSDHN